MPQPQPLPQQHWMLDLRRICDLHCSLGQHQILNLLGKARHPDPYRYYVGFLIHWATVGTPQALTFISFSQKNYSFLTAWGIKCSRISFFLGLGAGSEVEQIMEKWRMAHRDSSSLGVTSQAWDSTPCPLRGWEPQCLWSSWLWLCLRSTPTGVGGKNSESRPSSRSLSDFQHPGLKIKSFIFYLRWAGSYHQWLLGSSFLGG